MSATTAPWRVPARVEAGGEVVTVDRAWPGTAEQGVVRVTVEGRDGRGRLRAGILERGGRADLLPSGRDPRLPALAPLAADGELLVHRAGRRAVLRHDGGYTKVVRPGRSAAVAAAASTGRRLARAAGLDAPQVVRHDDRLGTLTTSVLAGRPVHDLSTDPSWDRVWSTWADAWERLQQVDATGLDLQPHTPDDEARVVGRWVGRASAAGLLPHVWAQRGDIARLHLGLDRPDRLLPAHRDLHDKQLLWDGSRLGVLDLDTACLAEPALDPANLAVHADLRRKQGLWSPEAAATVELAARRVARACGVDEDRWRTAQLATVVRLVCVYAFRPAWRDVVLAWAEDRWAGLRAG